MEFVRASRSPGAAGPGDMRAMNEEQTEFTVDVPQPSGRVRESIRNVALRNALRKRAEGVPTYSVPETAALLSISQEYLYRLIQASGFPAVRMRIGGRQGRYVIPAKAVEQLLDQTTESGECVDVEAWTRQWSARGTGGAA